MKRLMFSLFLSCCLLLCFAGSAFGITVDAASAILIDASTGRIIYQQDAHTSLAPASTTKVLTALVALEEIPDYSKQVKVPEDFENIGESSIYLEPGERINYMDLLYALMMASANDAGQVLAISICGSEENFVKLMNQRTAELGLTDSHWENVHGLDSDQHYTSAYDLAMIMREAAKIDLFNTIVTTDEYKMNTRVDSEFQTIYTHNQFLELYDGADGGKTGYTDAAGSCLVASATRGGLRLIGVVLNAQDRYAQMEKMMDYGFSKFSGQRVAERGDVIGSVRVLHGKIDTVDLVVGGDVVVPIEQGSSYKPEAKYDYPLTLETPFSSTEPIGTVTYADSLGNPISAPLYVTESAERYTFGIVWQQVWQKFLSVFL